MNSVKHARRVLWVKEIFRPVSGLTIPIGGSNIECLLLSETFPSKDSGHSLKADWPYCFTVAGAALDCARDLRK
jgi:hypothetical protein